MDRMAVTNDQLVEALRPVQDPELHRSIVDLGMLRRAELDAHRHRPHPGRPHRRRLPAPQRDPESRAQRAHHTRRRHRRRPRLHGDDRPGARGPARSSCTARRAPPPARPRPTVTPRVGRSRSPSPDRRPARCSSRRARVASASRASPPTSPSPSPSRATRWASSTPTSTATRSRRCSAPIVRPPSSTR